MCNQIKFRAWDGKKIYSEDLIISNGDVYENWRDFEDGIITSDTVMLYTGLKDSNGKEIYEGDIISNGREMAEVKFYEGCFMAQIEEGYAEAVFDYCIPFDDSCVVGNIYENPKLMEVSNV